MFLTDLNWLAVFAGFLVFFATGAIWFGPKTFYPVWVRALGSDPQATNTASMGLVFGLTALGGFLQVLTLAAVLHYVTADVTPLQGMLSGFLLSSGLVAASSLSHRLFSGQGLKVWLIEVSGDVVALSLAGFLYGLIG